MKTTAAPAYRFHTAEFGLDSQTVYFLRNRFCYARVPLAEASIFVGRGADIRNWQLLLAFGVGLLAFGLWYGCHVVDFLLAREGGRIYIEQIALPVFPVLLGAFAVIMALRRAPVMTVRNGTGQRRTVSLREVARQGHLPSLLNLLREQLPSANLAVAPDLRHW